ncbi:MAG: signal peptidase I [Gemmatimonadaceae bacterium]
MTDDARPDLSDEIRTGPDAPWPEAPDAPVVVAPRRFPVLRTTWEWAKSISMAIILFLLVRAFLVEAFKIPSGSMEGTLLVGDFLLVNKLVYGAEVPILRKHLPAVRDPRLGDVIVFQWPEDPEKSFVKRLVGLPHDTVEMRRGVLFRNGRAQLEPYAVRSAAAGDPPSEEFRWQRDYVPPAVDVRRYHPSRNNWGPLVVPADHYFVLGDNRDNSSDSRYWGFLPDTLVRGTPILVYYSYAPDSGHAFDWLTRVRWQRLGELIR